MDFCYYCYFAIFNPKYKWFGHNRVDLSRKAIRGSGGVGALIKESLLSLYNVETVDTSFDGILWLVLSPKGSVSNKN